MSTHLVQRERSFKPLSSPSVGKIGLLERLKGRRMEKNRSNHRQSRKTIAQSLMQDEIGSPNFSKDADRNLRLSQQARRRTWSVNTVMSDDSFLNSKYDHDSGSCRNVMEWMEKVCPEDLVPKILSFTGPQSIASISKVNRTWNLFISRETTWRIICEELYKVFIPVYNSSFLRSSNLSYCCFCFFLDWNRSGSKEMNSLSPGLIFIV